MGGDFYKEIFCCHDFLHWDNKMLFLFFRVSSLKNGTLKHSSNSDQRPLFQAESDRSVVQISVLFEVM